MKLSDMKPNKVYRLSRDVPNPDADRRVKRDAAYVPVWEKGLRFHLADGMLRRLPRYGTISRSHPGFHALIEALEPEPQTLDTLLFEAENLHHVDSRDILARLVADGRVTLAEIEAVVPKIRQAQRNEPHVRD